MVQFYRDGPAVDVGLDAILGDRDGEEDPLGGDVAAAERVEDVLNTHHHTIISL